MKKVLSFLIGLILTLSVFAQSSKFNESKWRAEKDSALRAKFQADSLAIDKEYQEQKKFGLLVDKVTYPLFTYGTYSGVIPVDNVTEKPDPKQDYKLLFELTVNNKDSLAGELNASLVEVERIINLHIASGIPKEKIFPVIIVHGPALFSFTNNDYYRSKYKTDNPNMKIMDELEKFGTKVIACGQAMSFLGVPQAALRPEIKISLTAKTVLSNYQLKGYVLYQIDDPSK